MFACGLRMFVLVIAVFVNGLLCVEFVLVGLLIYCCFLHFRLGVFVALRSGL